MNTVTMTGRLTRDPELRHLAAERAVAKMRIAVDNGRFATTYIDVDAFDGQAYTCAEFLTKGRKVAVTGRLALDEWRAPDGAKRRRYAIIGRVEFLDRPPQEEPAGDEPEPLGPEPQLALAA